MDALRDLACDDGAWAGTRAAVASRATEDEWAEALLRDFDVDGRSAASLLPFREIYAGNKKKHFQQLREASGVARGRVASRGLVVGALGRVTRSPTRRPIRT